MKRQQSSSTSTDWALCCICQQDGDLRSTPDDIQNLAENLLKHWEDEVLDFEPIKLTNKTEDGKPDFVGAMLSNNANYHHACAINYSDNRRNRKHKSLEKKQAQIQPQPSPGPSLRNAKPGQIDDDKIENHEICVLCGRLDNIENFHAAGALHASKDKLKAKHVIDLTEKWRKIALQLEDEELLARLVIGDLGANSAFYHRECCTQLHNRYRKMVQENEKGDIDIEQYKEAAFDKVIAYIHGNLAEYASGFVLKELESIYLDYLSNYDIQIDSHVTRFGYHLCERAPNLEIRKVLKQKRVLVSDSIDSMVDNHIKTSTDWIKKVRSIVQPIRDHMFELKGGFEGSLIKQDQERSVSPFLLTLISMTIDGEVGLKNKCSYATLTAAELITFHARKVQKSKTNFSSVARRTHKNDRETPVTIYIGLKLYSAVRSRTLIQSLYEIGVCISYDRILSITKSIYDSLNVNYDNSGIFLPQKMRKGIFLILLKDNIDKNARANLVHSHYHGTSISILQFPEYEGHGCKLDLSDYINSSSKSRKLSPLPMDYAEPQKLSSFTNDLFSTPNPCDFEDLLYFPELELARKDEEMWLEQTDPSNAIAESWSQYHASKNRAVPLLPGINALLPLLRDKVNTLEMQRHVMRLNSKAVSELNPNQTPVDMSDQPVYALTKEVQYRFPHEFKKYFAMLGGLHVEHCLLTIHGQLIVGSGLPEVLQLCSLATIGTQAVVDASHIKRARYGVQVILCALYKKLQDTVRQDRSTLSPMQWLTEKSKTSDMSFYWCMVMQLTCVFLP